MPHDIGEWLMIGLLMVNDRELYIQYIPYLVGGDWFPWLLS
jgi:hypothetical protein